MNTDKIAEIIKKTFGTKPLGINSVIVPRFAKDLARLFEEEDERIIGFNKYKPRFNPKQFLKKCGVQE